jgi:hypothetical protein
MDTKVLAEAKNEADGVTAMVAEAEGGYSLAIRDDDSGNFFSGVIIYPTLAAALANLNRAAGLDV